MARTTNEFLASVAEDLENEHSDVDSDDAGQLVPNRPAAQSPSQVYSVRIPVERLAELRVAAEARGVAPSALLRAWMLERLDSEAGAGIVLDVQGIDDEVLSRAVEEGVAAALVKLGLVRASTAAKIGRRRA